MTDASRKALLDALGSMPDEAFGYFVLACRPSAMTHGALAQIWPDGIGGFTGASRKSITDVRNAAEVYLEGKRS